MLLARRLLSRPSTLCRSLGTYEYLEVKEARPKVYQVNLNRPAKRNALSMEMWSEIGQCFNELSNTPSCRVVVLSGAGKMFCAGIDLGAFLSVVPRQPDQAHKSLQLIETIRKLQDDFTAVEKCRKPVIAAVHGPCQEPNQEILHPDWLMTSHVT